MKSAEIASLLAQALQWEQDKHEVAVAIVAKTWGSAPRPTGSRLIVRDDGLFTGSVSGGCIENEVVTAALEVAKSKATQVLHFGVADETAWEAGLSCGGKISIIVSALDADQSRLIVEAARERKTKVLLISSDGTVSKLLDPAQVKDNARCAQALASGQPVFADRAETPSLFIEPILPAWRMMIVGATHIAQALAPMAQLAGFEVIVIDPRETWARAERFPQIELVQTWPDEFFAKQTPDAATAVVTLTHDPKIDDPALVAAVAAKPRYIAALGSKNTHAQRRTRLAEQNNLSEQDLDSIHAPAGLALGARGHAEIAVSILAQAIAAFRGGNMQ